MRTLGVAGLMLASLVLTACDPAVNPYMALGKDTSTSATATKRMEFQFPQNKAAVHNAVLKVGSKEERQIVTHDEVSGLIIVEYPFSFVTNVWGGRLRLQLSQRGAMTVMEAQVYEKNRTVIDNVLLPFVDEVKTALKTAS